MKNALRAALVVVMGIGSVGCCCHGWNNNCCYSPCDDCCGGGCGGHGGLFGGGCGGGCGSCGGARSWWIWRPFCAGCGQRSHLDWWQNPPPCCNACDQCGQWHGQQYGSGPGGGYYSQDGMQSGGMMEDGEIVEDNGPPQPNPQPTPTPAASRRPVRRTSNVRMRSPAQYSNQYPNTQYSQQGQSMPQYRGRNAPPQYYDQ